MAKRKEKYLVYLREDYWGESGYHSSARTLVGETWAVSEAQAVNNFAYRNGTRMYGMKELPCDELYEWSYEADTETQMKVRYLSGKKIEWDMGETEERGAPVSNES